MGCVCCFGVCFWFGLVLFFYFLPFLWVFQQQMNAFLFPSHYPGVNWYFSPMVHWSVISFYCWFSKHSFIVLVRLSPEVFCISSEHFSEHFFPPSCAFWTPRWQIRTEHHWDGLLSNFLIASRVSQWCSTITWSGLDITFVFGLEKIWRKLSTLLLFYCGLWWASLHVCIFSHFMPHCLIGSSDSRDRKCGMIMYLVAANFVV